MIDKDEENIKEAEMDKQENNERNNDTYYFTKEDAIEQEIDLTHCQISQLDGISKLEKINTMYLRQNLFKFIEPNFAEFGKSLTHLDLYDNQIEHISNLESLINL
ncbi:hypothetical protein A3Q56_06898, partial [Intoshia linei]